MLLSLFLVGGLSAPPGIEEEFLAWMREHNIMFTGPEYLRRLQLFTDAVRYVDDHNCQSSYKLRLNQFAALSPSEYQSMLGYRRSSQMSSTDRRMATAAGREDSVNWVTTLRDRYRIDFPVRNHSLESCPSADWAFAAVEAVEYANAIDTHLQINLSVAFVLNCVATNSGCRGGNVERVYRYIINQSNGYFLPEHFWPYVDLAPYTPHNPNCSAFMQARRPDSVRIQGFYRIYDEDDLGSQVEQFGPVAAAVDASRDSFRLYRGGVYDDADCSPFNVNLAVVVVGYGVQDGLDGAQSYWILRNSWGVGWGEDGYMRLLRKKGHCGIDRMAFIPA
jgi:hypothetical protein